jgi:hypothetical protein
MMDFKSQRARNEHLETEYPDRKGCEVPGFYHLPDGRSLGVFCNSITLYEADSDEDERCPDCGRLTQKSPNVSP